MQITSSTDKVLKPTAIALGNFDGIHRGHRVVIEPILSTSSVPTVVSFNPHPQEFFTGKIRQLLTPLHEKVKQLESLGVKQLVLLPFNQQLAALSPQQFVSEIIVGKLQATYISVGADFCFGHGRSGTAKDLQELASRFEIKVNITTLHNCQTDQNPHTTVRISSSIIRKALKQGEIEQANRWLGRPYTLTGKVIEGQQLGRTIGFPTANLELPSNKFLPRYGVYAVRTTWQDPTGKSFQVNGVMNIGCRPTVEGTDPTVEVHLLNWWGNLYHQEITVSIIKFLRPERKFSSLEALQAQITADCELARNYLHE